jgi:predicted amidohydrolase YtcJ
MELNLVPIWAELPFRTQRMSLSRRSRNYRQSPNVEKTRSRKSIRWSGKPALPPLRPSSFPFLIAILISVQLIAVAQSRPPDLVVINAKVRTMTSPGSIVEAFAVSGGRIASVGSSNRIRRLIGPQTRVVDAKGRLVIPGFNDAHVHFMGIGNAFSSIDLRDVKTPDEITRRIERYARFLPKGRWILGGGWSVAAPDKLSVDRAAPNHPVFVYSADGQSAFANSLTMKRTGLRDDTGDVVRGDALRRIARIVPADHTRNWAEIAETASNYAASLGVTSVQDTHSDDLREVYRELHRNNKLKTRVYDCISLPDWKKQAGALLLQANNDMVRGGCLKTFSDGDDDAAPDLLRDVLAADKAGLQILVHAIGNSANGIVLDVLEQAAKTNGPRDRRFRVEHAHNPRPSDVPRFARSAIIASMQPYLFYGGGGGYYATLLKQKTTLAFGSDAAITDLNPLLGIHAAVNAGPESISVYDAVHAYTVGSAYAEFQEKEKGTIEVGRLADFVILSDDIFTVDPTRIRDSIVVFTSVNGRIVYGSE